MTDTDIYLICWSLVMICLVQMWLLWKADKEDQWDKVFLPDFRAGVACCVGVLALVVIMCTYFGTAAFFLGLFGILFLCVIMFGG